MLTDSDLPIRLAAFRWLEEQRVAHGEVLPWRVLLAGFSVAGERVPLVSQQGIFKPRLCRLPLSIRTSVGSPYRDAFATNGLLQYRYRGGNRTHHENVGLRAAMQEKVPLVYLHGHVEGRYHAIWPVFVVADDPAALTFTVEPRVEVGLSSSGDQLIYEEPEIARRYAMRTVRQRLHQRAFAERVIDAYGERCALCRLRHRELLDASHIIPDSDPEGEPRISNGLSLCKLHHAAFDQYFLTVDPDYRVRVRQDLLEEEDGPMLRHGLQELQGASMHLPYRAALRPDREALARRLELFTAR
jgi:putative restriction endonuclease